MIIAPEQAEMAVDMACRTALAQRGVSHLTVPIDVQEKKLEGNYSKHKVAGHTSDTYVNLGSTPDKQLIQKAADIINSGNHVVILVGQGALNAGGHVMLVSEKIKAPVVKALLGKAVIPDDHPNSLGGIGMLGTYPSVEAMNESDTLLMIGTSFPYIEYLPKPGQARGIQIDIKPERLGLRYPVEVGLGGDSNKILLALLPLLDEKDENSKQFLFLQSKQKLMKKWNDSLSAQSDLTDAHLSGSNKMIKSQSIASAVSSNLADESIVSVDS